MIKLYETGAYYADGKLIPDDGHAAEALAAMGRAVPKEEARKRTIAYSILEAHNTSGNMDDLKIKFDAMASHDITYVGIVQTARASGLEKFPLPYVLTNCHNSLCAVGGTINEDDHMFGLSAAKKYGGIYVPAHQAVIHQYMREMMSGCGKMILGSDSHTRYGALGTMGVGEGDAAVMDDKAVEQMQNLPGVEVATPIYSPGLQARIYAGKDDRYQMELWDITGMYAKAMPKMGYTLLEGEYPTGPQTEKKKPIYVVVGEYTGYSFQDNKKKFDNYRWPETDENGELKQKPFVDIMNDELILRSNKQDEDDPDSTQFSREIKPVGRVKQDYDKGWETSQGIIMDIEDIKWLEAEYNRVNKIKTSTRNNKGYSNVTVKVATMEDVEPVQEAIKAMGFETNSAEDVRKPMQEQARQQQKLDELKAAAAAKKPPAKPGWKPDGKT